MQAGECFPRQGGTIGRAASCDWVLSHRKVSGRHATISYQDSVFYIVDEQSANGVFLNSTKNRLVPGRRYALKQRRSHHHRPVRDGGVDLERARGGGSTFVTRISAMPGPAGQARPTIRSIRADPFAPAPLRTPRPLGSPAPTPKPTPAGEVVPLEELDPLKLLEGTPQKAPARQAPSARDLEKASPMAGHYQPPAVLTPPPVTPLRRTPRRPPRAGHDPGQLRSAAG